MFILYNCIFNCIIVFVLMFLVPFLCVFLFFQSDENLHYHRCRYPAGDSGHRSGSDVDLDANGSGVEL